jgi:hypothetical protein
MADEFEGNVVLGFWGSNTPTYVTSVQIVRHAIVLPFGV